MLMLLKNTRKEGGVVKDVALRAAMQPWVVSVCGGEAADGRDDRQGTGVRATDGSLQRANIKLGKYH